MPHPNARAALLQAATLLKQGNKQEAKRIISEILKAEPTNADAWYLASVIVEDPAKKIQSLERALAADPLHSRAKQALTALRLRESQSVVVQPVSRKKLDMLTLLTWIVGVMVLVVVVGSVVLVATRTNKTNSVAAAPTTQRGGSVASLASAAASPVTLTALPTSTRRPTATVPWRGRLVLSISDRSQKSTYFTVNADGSDLHTLSLKAGLPPSVWSPDGKHLAYIQRGDNSDIKLYVADADGNHQKPISAASEGEVAWSANSQRLVTMSNTDPAQIMDADGTHLSKLDDVNGTMPVWSPDGTHIAFVSPNANSISILDVQSSQVHSIDALNFETIYGVDWLDDNQLLTAGNPADSREVTFYRLSMNSGTPQKLFSIGNTQITRMALSPDRQYVAFISKPPQFKGAGYQYRLAEESGLFLLNLQSREFFSLFVPDGKAILASNFLSWQAVSAPAPADTTSDAASEPLSGQLGYISYRESKWGIYQAQADGSNEHLWVSDLTDQSAQEIDALSLSPDSKLLAVRTSSGVDLRDSRGTLLHYFKDNDIYWRPGGGYWLAQNCTGPQPGICIKSPDAPPETAPTILYIPLQYAFAFPGPLARSEHTIAFTDVVGNVSDLFVINDDGTGLQNLTQSSSMNINSPQWSPDGKKIVFSGQRTVTNDNNTFYPTEIYTINADGSGLQQLTKDGGYAFTPVWSPDGHFIAFVSDRDGIFSIYVMTADGSGIRRVTKTFAPNLSPIWFTQLAAPDPTALPTGTPTPLVKMCNTPEPKVATLSSLLTKTPISAPIPNATAQPLNEAFKTLISQKLAAALPQTLGHFKRYSDTTNTSSGMNVSYGNPAIDNSDSEFFGVGVLVMNTVAEAKARITFDHQNMLMSAPFALGDEAYMGAAGGTTLADVRYRNFVLVIYSANPTIPSPEEMRELLTKMYAVLECLP